MADRQIVESKMNYFELLFTGKYNEAEDLMKKSIPSRLYNYVSLGNDKDCKKFVSLQEDSIWFSKINMENDPYEFKGLCMNREELSKHGWTKDLMDRWEQGLSFRDSMIMACLSENNYQNAAMWGHYANNWAGFCVEYSVEKPEYIHKVFYEPERIKASSLYSEIIKTLMCSDDKQLEIYSHIFKENFYIKHISWAWEKEYRIVSPFLGIEKGKNIKHTKIGIRVNAIVSGINCSNENQVKLKEICNKLHFKYGHVELRQSDYGVDIAWEI